MAQPTTVPEWADGASAAITVPLAGTQQLGFTNGERPPAQYLNWLFNLIYQWVLYLKAQIFVGGVTITGGLTVDVLHTTHTRITAHSEAQPTTTGPVFGLGTAVGWTVGTSTGRLYYPLRVNAGETITTWQLFVTKASASGTITAQLFSFDANAGGEVAIGTAFTQTVASGYVQMGKVVSQLVSATAQYYLVFTGGGVTGDFTYSANVTVTT